ncbi:MAG: hypothetical protein FJ221_15875 [Lentisphaerae bacterium]|nr:hypothetical protein [Lentisphaerota bacterium]
MSQGQDAPPEPSVADTPEANDASPRKPSRGDTWFAVSRADLQALRCRWTGVKLATRQAVYLAFIELANFLNRRTFTTTCDRLAAATGLTTRHVPGIVRDLKDAGLIRLTEHHRLPNGRWPPYEVTLAGRTPPRVSFRPRQSKSSSQEASPMDSYCSHPSPCQKENPRRGASNRDPRSSGGGVLTHPPVAREVTEQKPRAFTLTPERAL